MNVLTFFCFLQMRETSNKTQNGTFLGGGEQNCTVHIISDL